MSQPDVITPAHAGPQESGGDAAPVPTGDGARATRGNRLLGAIPEEDFRRLAPDLAIVALDSGQVIYQPDEPIRDVYFPIDAVISVISVMSDGSTVEVATVGNEGMAGVAVFLGAPSTPYQSLSQVPGTAARLSADALHRATADDAPLARLLRRYTQALLNQVAQSAACNRLHALDERCARWLLMMHDRAQVDHFPLTQQFLAQMLGVRRATVTVAAGHFQQAGLIRYSRGKITVLDRAGLEAASCECYAIVRRQIEQLLA